MRTQWVFRHACGCPFGVLDGSCAAVEYDAWRDFYERPRDIRKAQASGVTVEFMDHARTEAISSLRSRGEESGVPDDYMRAVPFCDDYDEELQIARVVGVAATEGAHDRLYLDDEERYELDLTFLSIVEPGSVPE